MSLFQDLKQFTNQGLKRYTNEYLKNNTIEVQETEPSGLIKFIGKIVYPIGSIYTTTSAISPQSIFGGTWVEITGKMLMGKDSANTYNESMGSFETPVYSHTHTMAHTHGLASGGGHSHYIGAATDTAASGSAVWRTRGVSSTDYTTWYNSSYVKHLHTFGDTIQNTSNVVTAYTTGGGRTGDITTKDTNMPPFTVVKMWERTAL